MKIFRGTIPLWTVNLMGFNKIESTLTWQEDFGWMWSSFYNRTKYKYYTSSHLTKTFNKEGICDCKRCRGMDKISFLKRWKGWSDQDHFGYWFGEELTQTWYIKIDKYSINYPLLLFRQQELLQRSRTYAFDPAWRQYLKDHPYKTVIENDTTR